MILLIVDGSDLDLVLEHIDLVFAFDGFLIWILINEGIDILVLDGLVVNVFHFDGFDVHGEDLVLALDDLVEDQVLAILQEDAFGPVEHLLPHDIGLDLHVVLQVLVLQQKYAAPVDRLLL